MSNLKKAGLATFAISMLLMLVGCGGLKTRFSIRAKDIISEERLSINMYVRKSNMSSPSQRFSVHMNLEELANTIAKADSSLSVAIYQDRLIRIQTESGFFFVTSVEKEEEDRAEDTRYVLFAPVAVIKVDTPRDFYICMYIPYHLIEGIEIQTSFASPDMYPETFECNADGTIEDFINFYSVLEQCQVDKTGDDSIVVTSKQNGYQMQLSFYQDGEQPKVTFTVLNKSV